MLIIIVIVVIWIELLFFWSCHWGHLVMHLQSSNYINHIWGKLIVNIVNVLDYLCNFLLDANQILI